MKPETLEFNFDVQQTMHSAKDWILGTGVITTCLGLYCLPLGQEAGPKRILSIFTRSVDAGAFASIGWALLAGGVVIIGLSLLIRRR